MGEKPSWKHCSPSFGCSTLSKFPCLSHESVSFCFLLFSCVNVVFLCSSKVHSFFRMSSFNRPWMNECIVSGMLSILAIKKKNIKVLCMCVCVCVHRSSYALLIRCHVTSPLTTWLRLWLCHVSQSVFVYWTKETVKGIVRHFGKFTYLLSFRKLDEKIDFTVVSVCC